jgi:hypothetical protein
VGIQQGRELNRFWPEQRWPARKNQFSFPVCALFWLLFWARKKVTKTFRKTQITQPNYQHSSRKKVQIHFVSKSSGQTPKKISFIQ